MVDDLAGEVKNAAGGKPLASLVRRFVIEGLRARHCKAVGLSVEPERAA